MKSGLRITKKSKATWTKPFGDSCVDGLYWVPVDEAVLSEVQLAHDACAPFFHRP